MKAYSPDLRERVIALIQAGDLSQPQIAEQLKVSLGTVENWWRRWRTTASLAPAPFAGGAQRTLKPCQAAIQAALKEQPDATLEELCEQVAAAMGVRASPSMMCRELQHLKLPRKKVLARQSARHPARAKAAAQLSAEHSRAPARHRRPAQIHR